MAQEQGNAGGGENQNQPQRRGSGLGMCIQIIVVMVVINFFRSPSAQKDPRTGKVLPPQANLWRDNQPFSLHVYTSESSKRPKPAYLTEEHLLWHVPNLKYNWDEDNEKTTNITLQLSEPRYASLANNQSLWAHIFFTKAGHSHLRGTPGFKRLAVIYRAVQLNVFQKKPRVSINKNLLSGEYKDDRVTTQEEALAQSDAPDEWRSYWRPTLHLRLVHDFTAYPRGTIPPQIRQHMGIDAFSKNYFPTVYVDNFWILKEHLLEINETVDSLNLTMMYSPIGQWKWQLELQMEASWKLQQQWGASEERETDELKRIVLDTDPYLLALTFVVSLLHTIFDMLAFKNDIQFWASRKNTEGLSVRSIFLNCGCQIVIVLYLWENETSWMILVSSAVGTVIEFWKITRAVIIKRKETFPFITYEDHPSSIESRTAKYDAQAIKYLSYALYPLIIGYSIYSLIYEEHKSWYHWVLGSLVGTVYTFGFIMMCPQLYVNYKLRSVAHLPWRMMTYRALNTFIDDLFAFIITMPTMHRLSCFRDDIVFFIFLYQMYIYRKRRPMYWDDLPADDQEASKMIFDSYLHFVDKPHSPADIMADYFGDAKSAIVETKVEEEKPSGQLRRRIPHESH